MKNVNTISIVSLIVGGLSLCLAVFATVKYIGFTHGSESAQVSGVSGAAADTTANKGDIVYIQLDRILQEYDMANDLRSVVETKVQNIQAEVDRRGRKLEGEIRSFQEKVSKGLITRSSAEVQGQELQKQEAEFNNYAAQKQNEINEEQVVMMNQLADAIKTFLDKYNEEKQYAMILTNQGGSPVITGDEALDITDDVLAGLNEEYVKNKNKKD